MANPMYQKNMDFIIVCDAGHEISKVVAYEVQDFNRGKLRPVGQPKCKFGLMENACTETNNLSNKGRVSCDIVAILEAYRRHTCTTRFRPIENI